jgi:hypothetical protein
MPHGRHIKDKKKGLGNFSLDENSHHTGDAALTPASPQNLFASNPVASGFGAASMIAHIKIINGDKGSNRTRMLSERSQGFTERAQAGYALHHNATECFDAVFPKMSK